MHILAMIGIDQFCDLPTMHHFLKKVGNDFLIICFIPIFVNKTVSKTAQNIEQLNVPVQDCVKFSLAT